MWIYLFSIFFVMSHISLIMAIHHTFPTTFVPHKSWRGIAKGIAWLVQKIVVDFSQHYGIFHGTDLLTLLQPVATLHIYINMLPECCGTGFWKIHSSYNKVKFRVFKPLVVTAKPSLKLLMWG